MKKKVDKIKFQVKFNKIENDQVQITVYVTGKEPWSTNCCSGDKISFEANLHYERN